MGCETTVALGWRGILHLRWVTLSVPWTWSDGATDLTRQACQHSIELNGGRLFVFGT
jgi:hypothetical protein